jgi:predicted GNAT family acetyltransferase
MFMGREKEVEKQDMNTRWQIGNLFVHPSHRGQGIGLTLGMAAYEYARTSTLQLLRDPASKFSLRLMPLVVNGNADREDLQQEEGKQDRRAIMRVRCLVKQTPTSGKLIKMYKSYWGFKELHRRWTLKEVFEAGSDRGLVPAGWEEMSKWNTRDLTVLESVVIVRESDARQRVQVMELIGGVVVGKDAGVRSKL